MNKTYNIMVIKVNLDQGLQVFLYKLNILIFFYFFTLIFIFKET
jgi:hypothetical protein